jgi:sialate O-acetylesterase
VQISEGLFSQMVLQRTKSNQSRAMFAGACQALGAVEARVRANGRVLPGWNWKRVGTATGRKFFGKINGLKTGGPYDVDLRISKKGAVLDTMSVVNVMVGDVWILAGQSNMEGIGWLKDKLPPMKTVRAFYMTDEWDVAADPLHTLWCAVDPVHGGNPAAKRVQQNRHVGVGPGVSFGQEMFSKTGIPQGLLACGHGGTSMSQWDPAKKKMGGGSLYGAMCRRVKKNGGAVAGVFWYQGCNETTAGAAAVYTPRMKKLVQSMRRDFKDARLPVVIVQIGRMDQTGIGESWDSVREQQRRLPGVIANLATVPVMDLALDDGIHLSGVSQNILGCRAAQAMEFLRGGKKAGLPPIEVRDVQVKPNPISKCADVIVRFKNLDGALTSGGAPTGFSLMGCARHPYRTDLEGDQAILHFGCTVETLEGELFYGRGFFPHCNITDKGGRSIPAFGPLPLQASEPRAVTPFVNNLRISEILPGVDVRKLGCPEKLKLQDRQFPANFCDRHLELGPAGEALVYYAFNFRCAVPMKLNLLFGYDGPAKVWLDRKSLFCDPKGTNPARPEDAVIPFAAKAGGHEMLVALGSHGAAWGVFLRLERTDVSARMLRKNPHGVIKPEILG